jgi:hypothetical protein
MRPLGICWILYGAWRLLLGVLLAICAGTATVMFGALLTRVADPYSLMGFFHAIYLGTILHSALCGVLAIVCGMRLLAHGKNARGIAVLAALFSLPELPVGVILGSYTLYVLALGGQPSAA